MVTKSPSEGVFYLSTMVCFHLKNLAIRLKVNYYHLFLKFNQNQRIRDWVNLIKTRIILLENKLCNGRNPAGSYVEIVYVKSIDENYI